MRDIDWDTALGHGANPLPKQLHKIVTADGPGVRRVVLQFRFERVDYHLALFGGSCVKLLILKKNCYAMRGLLHEIVEVEILGLDCHCAYGC